MQINGLNAAEKWGAGAGSRAMQIFFLDLCKFLPVYSHGNPVAEVRKVVSCTPARIIPWVCE